MCMSTSMDKTKEPHGSGSIEGTSLSWRYVREGNASLVIGHKRKPIVYHLQKCDIKTLAEQDCGEKNCKTKISYIEQVLKPLFGTYVIMSQCIPVTSDFVLSVSQAFESQRPAKRRHRVVSPAQRFLLSQPNLCFLEENSITSSDATLTFEIKPKLGFLPLIREASLENETKKTICYYCMEQVLKRKKGDWNHTSQYCPINFFSGNPKRMQQALKGLFSTPQNNLCIFKDGELIYPEHGKSLPSQEELTNIAVTISEWLSDGPETPPGGEASPGTNPRGSSLDDLISLLVQALCHPCGDLTKMEVAVKELPWKPCLAHHCDDKDCNELDLYELPKGCILYRILTAQLLGFYSIKFIYPVYRRYMDYITRHPEHREKFSITNPCISDYLNVDPSMDAFHHPDQTSSLSIETCVSLLRRYVVSRTARDCSVMVTLQPTCSNDISRDDVISVGGRRFQFACRLIDLDPKSPSKIPHYYRYEQLMMETYLSS